MTRQPDFVRNWQRVIMNRAADPDMRRAAFKSLQVYVTNESAFDDSLTPLLITAEKAMSDMFAAELLAEQEQNQRRINEALSRFEV